MKILLFNISDVYNKSMINRNVVEERLMPILERIQDTYVYALIGRENYEQLQTKKINNTLTANELTLINEYLLACFVAKVEIEALYLMNFELRNKGAGQILDQNYQALSTEQIKAYVKSINETLKVLENRLYNYITETQVINLEKYDNTQNFNANISML